MKKIKICFISFLAYPLFNKGAKVVFGGAEVDLYNLAKKLEESDKYDITFYVGDYGQKHEEMYGNIRVRKFKYMNLEKYTTILTKVLRHMNILLEVAAMDYDICMIEAYNEMLGWVALIPGNIGRGKTIFRLAHDLDTDLKDAANRGFLYGRLYKYGIKKANAVVSQTEIQKDMLMKNLGIDSQVIKNGFFINEGINFSDKAYILWVARAQSWKRPELFLEMVKRLPGEEFKMIIPGDNPLQALIKERAAQYENLEVIEYVPFIEIQNYYNRAKLFVNTSEYEGFPNAFVQACLGKTPILSFNVNPDNFIGENKLGFFCQDKLEAAVDFIKDYTLLQLKTLGENANNYVKENHDISKIYHQYEEIIESLEIDKRKGAGLK